MKNTFKAIEEYISDYEEKLFSDYMRAKQAKLDWNNAKHTQATMQMWEAVKNGLFSNKLWGMSMFSGCALTPNARQISEPVDTISVIGTAYLILDTYIIGGKKYDTVVCARILDNAGNFHSLSLNSSIVSKYDQFNTFICDRNVYLADIDIATKLNESALRTKAHKEAEAHRKWLEKKINSVLGEIAEIKANDTGAEWFLTDINGKKAHLWFIEAGGYNIQRAHIRCLIKEVK